MVGALREDTPHNYVTKLKNDSRYSQITILAVKPL
jgi:hypothetical protein